MNRESRSVTLAILTLFVYAGIILLTKGSFIFPFPLNEIVFLIVSIQFTVWNWTKDKILWTIIILTGFFNLFSTQFFWSFFLNTDSMHSLVEGLSLDLLKILYFLFLITWIGIYFFTSSLKWKYFFGLIPITLIIWATLENEPIIETTGLLIVAVLGTIKKIHSPVYLLWILLAVLQVMKIWMLNY